MLALYNYCTGLTLCSSLPSQGHAYFMGPCPYKPVVRRKITGNHRGDCPYVVVNEPRPQATGSLWTLDS